MTRQRYMGTVGSSTKVALRSHFNIAGPVEPERWAQALLSHPDFEILATAMEQGVRLHLDPDAAPGTRSCCGDAFANLAVAVLADMGWLQPFDFDGEDDA